ncbi:N-acetyltransferase [Tenggerimyces flavus]|uniref:N-acetyltransferase n=1 Tax=Tenggerimyces flavus TaxID=1708749 RepID=A0ABV7Y3K9_9ACTN|nr:N-acetyltransferase [Tenggerimyces flavus]MBM7790802.1 GNAT superfamily N-acetyltransferase [Tenggerimyces flavus]
MITLTTVAERPEYADRLYEFEDTWPTFMAKDLLANALFWQVAHAFPAYCVVALDPSGAVVGRGRSAPFGLAERGGELPDGGWDAVLLRAFYDQAQKNVADAVSALEVAISPAYLGQGLSGRILSAMREAAAGQGHRELFAPVRPTAKHEQPSLSMAEYVQLVRPDGLPVDPWLRVHARAGASIVKVAPRSMTISGSLAEWREWTGLPFDTDGPVTVPQALIPVHCDTTHDYAVYVEPNVWMRHPL